MSNIIQKTSLTVLTVSVLMVGFGFIPQSFAQTAGVDATITIIASCGISVVGAPVTLAFGSVAPDAAFSDFFQVTNGGTSVAEYSANVGDNLSGGFAGDVDLTTHIEPTSIDLTLGLFAGSGGPQSMLNTGLDTVVGNLDAGDTATMTVDGVATIVNTPFDGAASATFTLTVSDCDATLTPNFDGPGP